ncbi:MULTISPECIES: hypothetical protein [Methylobacterium]|nr:MULTISPECIES: hypothetical protein [Methylobacterium]ACB24507.1 hypothetical protein Mrad2831_2513 [Methylobacterium radiotolerans JCM 2831]GEN01334.1 hypothetical protein MRA01_58730 [Methylobacterium radiotolerans]
MRIPLPANSNMSPTAQAAMREAWIAARRPRLVADADASPEQAALLAARAEVAARRRDALARLTREPAR